MDTTTTTKATTTVNTNSIGASVSNREVRKYSKTHTLLTAYDLDNGDASLTVSTLYFDENNVVIEDSHAPHATVYVSQESLVTFAREVLKKFES